VAADPRRHPRGRRAAQPAGARARHPHLPGSGAPQSSTVRCTSTVCCQA
jgi:hypothetical protein